MKEVLLKNGTIYMIDENRLTTVTDSETEEMEIFDYDFDIKPSKVFIKDKLTILEDNELHDLSLKENKLYFLNNNSLYYFDLKEEKSKPIMDFEEKSVIFISNIIYEATYLNKLLTIKSFDFNSNLLEEKIFNFSSHIDAVIEESNLFMSNLWDDEELTLPQKDELRALTISNNDNFAVLLDNKLLFGKLSNDNYQTINVPAIDNMNLNLSLNNAVATIDAKDGDTSFTFTLELPLKRKRRGAILKYSINILKRGVDQITPFVSENGKFWFGVDGEENFYPLIVNLKTLSPIGIFGDTIDNSFRITASKDLKEIIITNFNLLRKYSWNEEGIIFDYEVEI